jgi:hypothetical protein
LHIENRRNPFGESLSTKIEPGEIHRVLNRHVYIRLLKNAGLKAIPIISLISNCIATTAAIEPPRTRVSAVLAKRSLLWA